MLKTTNEKESIVLTDANLWQEISNWLAAAVGAVIVVFLKFVHWWAGNRFRKVDEEIAEAKAEAAEAKQEARAALDKAAEHGEQLAAIHVHIQTGSDQRTAILVSVETLHADVKKLIARRD